MAGLSDFNYQGYMTAIGVDPSVANRDFTDEEKSMIYQDAVKRFYQAYGQEISDSPFYSTPKERHEYALEKTLTLLPDGRNMFGLPQQRNPEDIFNTEDFRNFVANEGTGTENMDYLLDTYAAKQTDKDRLKWEFGLEGMTKKQFRELFAERTGIDESFTRDDILNRRFGAQYVGEAGEAKKTGYKAAAYKSMLDAKVLALKTAQTLRDALPGENTESSQWLDNLTENAKKAVEDYGYVGKYDNVTITDALKEGPFTLAGKIFTSAVESWATSGASIGAAIFLPFVAPGAAAAGGATAAATGLAARVLSKEAIKTIARGGLKLISALGSAQEIGGVRQEIEEKNLYDPNNPLDAIMAGAVAASLDRVGAMSARARLAAFRHKSVTEGMRSGLRGEQLTKFLELKMKDSELKQIEKYIKRGFVGNTLMAMGTEGFTEGLQEFPGMLLAKHKGHEYTTSEWINRPLEAGLVGAVLGGGTHVAGTLTGKIAGREKTVQDVTEEQKRIRAELAKYQDTGQDNIDAGVRLKVAQRLNTAGDLNMTVDGNTVVLTYGGHLAEVTYDENRHKGFNTPEQKQAMLAEEAVTNIIQQLNESRNKIEEDLDAAISRDGDDSVLTIKNPDNRTDTVSTRPQNLVIRIKNVGEERGRTILRELVDRHNNDSDALVLRTSQEFDARNREVDPDVVARSVLDRNNTYMGTRNRKKYALANEEPFEIQVGGLEGDEKSVRGYFGTKNDKGQIKLDDLLQEARNKGYEVIGNPSPTNLILTKNGVVFQLSIRNREAGKNAKSGNFPIGVDVVTTDVARGGRSRSETVQLRDDGGNIVNGGIVSLIPSIPGLRILPGTQENDNLPRINSDDFTDFANMIGTDVTDPNQAGSIRRVEYSYEENGERKTRTLSFYVIGRKGGGARIFVHNGKKFVSEMISLNDLSNLEDSELSRILNEAISANNVPYLTRNPIKSASEIGYTVYEINRGRKDTLGRRAYILEAKDSGGNTFYWEIRQGSKGEWTKIKRGKNSDEALFNRILQVASATSIEDLEKGFLSQFRDGAVFIIENKGGAKPWYLSYDGKPTQKLRKALHTQDMAKANEVLAALNDADRQGKEPYTIKAQPAWYIGHPECQEAVLFGMHSETATPEEIAAFLQEARKYALAVSMKEMDAPSAADSEVGVSVSDTDELAEDTLADPVAQDEAANDDNSPTLDELLEEEEDESDEDDILADLDGMEFLGGETTETTQVTVTTEEELIDSSIKGLGDAFQKIKKDLSGLKIMIKDTLRNAVNFSNSLEDIANAYNKISGRSTIEITDERVTIRGNNNNIISEFPRSDFEKIKTFLSKSGTLDKIFDIKSIAQEIHKQRGGNHQIDPAPFILEFFKNKVRSNLQSEETSETTQIVDSATEQVDAEMAAVAPAADGIVDVIAQQISNASGKFNITITDGNGVNFTLTKNENGQLTIASGTRTLYMGSNDPKKVADSLRRMGFVENTQNSPVAPVETSTPSESSTAALDAQVAELNEIVAQTEAILADTPASVPEEAPAETQSTDEPTLAPPSPTTVRRRRKGQTTSEPVTTPSSQEPVQEVVEESAPSDKVHVEKNLLKRKQVVERVKKLKEGETLVVTDGGGFRYAFKKTAEGIEARFYGDTGNSYLYKNEKGIARYLSEIGFAETIVSRQEAKKEEAVEQEEKDYSFSITPTNYIFNELKRVEGLIKKLEKDWKKAQEKSEQPSQNQLVKYKPLTKKRMEELKEMGDEAHDELAAKLQEAMKVYLSDFMKLLQLSAARAGVMLDTPSDAQMNFPLNHYLNSAKTFVDIVNRAMNLEDSTFDFKNILSEQGRITDLSKVFDHIRNEQIKVPETAIVGLLSVSDEESPLRGSMEVTEAEREFARVNLLFALSNTGVVSFDKLSTLMHLGAVRTVVNQAEAWRIVTANRSSVEPRYSVDGKIQGFVLNGRIYLVADELQRTGQYAGVFLHECGVHFRKFGMSDQGFKEILDTVKNRVQDVKALAEVKGKENLTKEERAFLDAVRRVEKTGMDESNEHYWEEVTAYVVEKFPSTEQGLIGRVVSWFRSYLYRWGFLDPKDIRISDLVAFARGAARGIGVSNFSYNWSEVAGDQGVMDDFAEKFGMTSDELLKQYTDTYKQYRYNEDGTEKGDYLKAPNGKYSNLVNDAYPADSVNSGKFGRERLWVLTRTPAFIEWFGDWINNPNENMSLDENGEPRIVYRAANEDAVTFDDKLDATVFEDDKSQVFAGFISSKDGSFRSIDSNGNFDRQSSNIKFSFVDLEGAKRLDAAFGVSTRMADYEAAIEMYNNGAEEWEIKLFTNWHKGNDGIWRYELSDKDFKVKIEEFSNENFNDFLEEIKRINKKNHQYLSPYLTEDEDVLDLQREILEDLFGKKLTFKDLNELRGITGPFNTITNDNFDEVIITLNNYADIFHNSHYYFKIRNLINDLLNAREQDRSKIFYDFKVSFSEKYEKAKNRYDREASKIMESLDWDLRNFIGDYFKSRTFRLEDFISHRLLFIAYPDLKEITVRFAPITKENSEAYFAANNSKEAKDFTIVIDIYKKLKRAKNKEDALRILESTTLHEVTHAIQHLSGFSPGVHWSRFNSSKFSSILRNVHAKMEENRDNLYYWFVDNFSDFLEIYLLDTANVEVDDKGNLSRRYLGVDKFSAITDEIFRSIDYKENLKTQLNFSRLGVLNDYYLKKYFSDKEMKKLEEEYESLRDAYIEAQKKYKLLSKPAFDLYFRAMGELEARVVTQRMDIEQKKLRLRPISTTELEDEKIPKDELIDARSLFSEDYIKFSFSEEEEQSYSDIRKEVKGAPGVYLHGDGTFSFNQREMPQGRENETLVYGVVRGTRRARELASVQKLREWLRNNQLAEELGKVEAGNTVFPSNAREDLDTRLGAMMRWAILNEGEASEMPYSVDESGNPISFYEGVVQAIRDAAHVSLHTSQLDWTDEMMASVANALGGFENEVLDPSKPPTQIFAGLNRNMDRFSDANVFRDVVSSLAQNDAVEADDYDENGNGIIRPVDDSVESAVEEDNFEYVVNLDLENPNAGPAERREAMRAAVDRLKGARGVGWHNDLNDFYQNIAAKYDTEADEVNGAFGEPARREDVERFLEAALPFHIRERIEIHYEPVPLAKEILRGAYGIFFPFARGKKMIHVRAWDRTFGQVIATVAHESSHFGWSMWGSSRLEKAISDLYMHTDDDGNLVVAQKMYEVIPQYFQMFGYNESTLHMVPEARRVYLMDEYFARINHDLLGSNTTDVAAAIGIDSARYTELKRDIDLAIAEVHSNLMQGISGMADDETVKAFAEDILKMTMGSTIGRGVDAYYDIEGTDVGGGKRTPTNRVYIYVNDYGQRRQEVAQTDEGQMIGEIREVLQKWEAKFGRVGKNFAKFILQNFPMRNHFRGIGKNGSIIPGLHVEHGKLGEQIATAHAAVMIGHVMRKISENMGVELRKRNDAYEHLVSAFKDKHFDPAVLDEHSGTTYVEKITDLGYGNDKKLMDSAKLADESIAWCRNQILGNALEIRRMIKLQADNLARRMRAAYTAARMDPNEIIERIEKMYAQMGEMASKYSGEWTHRMYRSYSEEGYIDLSHMLDYLTRNPNDGRPRFKEEQEIAQRKLDNLDELRGKAVEDGGITEDMYRTMSEQPKRILRLAKRLDALEAYVKTKMGLKQSVAAGAEYPVIVLNRMIAEIKEVMGDSEKQMKGRIGDDHLNTISAAMKRELDDRRQLDRLYMEFLEPETNRLKTLLHSVDQQNKILMKLQFNMELGEHILDTGMGNLQGLGRGERRSSDLGFLERGSFLQFIEIEDIFMEALEKEYAVQRSLRETVWGGVIDAWKANNTIYSLKLGISNYVGNISLLMAGGHFLRWGNMRVGSAVAWNQWKERMGLIDENDWRNKEKEIIDLMRENHLLGGTVSDTRMIVGNTGIHEQVIHEVFKGLRAINSIGFVGERQMENAVKNILNRFRQFYAYGDEWIKPMIFMNNLDVAYAKYEAMPEFADMAPEERKRLAAREAARQTMRESTTWEMTSRVARELSARSIRLVTPDFVMHNFQMMRIIAANFVRHGEIGDELRKLDDLEKLQGRLTEKQVAYRSQLADERVRRKVGGAFTMSAYGTLMATGMGLIPYLMNMFLATLNADSDDDEEKKKARQQKFEEGRNGAFTPREWDGAVRMVNWLTGGNNLHSPVFRDRWNIYTWNYVRSNAMLTHAPVRSANDEWHPSDVMYQMLTNLMDLQSGTMTQELINNVLGRDKWGREIGVEEGLLRVMNRAIIPGAVRQLWQVAFETPSTDTLYHSGKAIKVPELAGITVNKYDIRDVTNRLGYFLKEKQSNSGNYHRRDFKAALDRGKALSDGEILELVRKLKKNNQYEMGKATYLLTGLREIGMTEQELTQYLTVSRKGADPLLGQEWTKKFLSGSKIFDESMIEHLKRERNTLIKGRESLRMSRQELATVLQNYDKAIRIYSQALRTN